MAYRTKRTRETQEKPLLEVLGERKSYYKQRISEAFSGLQIAIDNAYKKGSIGYIEKFERALLKLSEAINISFTPYEKGLEKVVVGIPEKIEEVDKRPRLTRYQYYKSRDAGMTNEEIKKKFRIDNPYTLSGYGRWYKHYKKQGKEKTSAGTKKETDNRPLLAKYEDYAKLRDAGMTNEQIKEVHKIKKLHQISGWGSYYSKATKKKTQGTQE